MRPLLAAVAAVVVLAGCGGDEPTEPWYDEVEPAAAADNPPPAQRIGGADSQCPVPAEMEVARNWNLVQEAFDLSKVGRTRPEQACVLSGNNQPDVGTMVIWLGPASEPRKALEEFVVAAEWRDADQAWYRDTTLGQGRGVEATTGTRRAFAASTPSNTIVVDVFFPGREEFLAFALPAYLLAKQSFTPLDQ